MKFSSRSLQSNSRIVLPVIMIRYLQSSNSQASVGSKACRRRELESDAFSMRYAKSQNHTWHGGSHLGMRIMRFILDALQGSFLDLPSFCEAIASS